MNVRLHAPTIEHIRAMLAASCAELPIHDEDLVIRGAAVIGHDVLTAIDVTLAGLLMPQEVGAT